MKPVAILSFFLLLIPAKDLFPQAKYEKGFIIGLQDDTIFGLIKNYDRVKNPSTVSFKETKNSKVKTYKPEDIKKFRVGPDLYLSARINLSVLSGKTDTADNESLKVWVFLLAMVEGTKSLYYYTDRSLTGHYFITQNKDFTILNYSEYVSNETEQKIVKRDQRFKGQLMLYLQECPSIKEYIDDMSYNEKDLIKLFRDYYTCTSDMTYSRTKNKLHVEIGPLGGVGLTNVTFKHAALYHSITPVANADYQSSYLPVYGGFLELVFPKNHQKWSVFFEGLYSPLHITGEYINQGSYPQNHTDYHIDIAVDQALLSAAVRYKINIGILKVFFDVGITYGLTLSSKTTLNAVQYYLGTVYEYPEAEAIGIKDSEESAFAGAGIKLTRLSFEVRYKIGDGITIPGTEISTETKTEQLSFVLGLRIL